MLFVAIYVWSLIGCCLSFGYLIYDQFKKQQEFTVGNLGIVIVMLAATIIPYVNMVACVLGVWGVIDSNQDVVLFSKKEK